jgi:hypothetical protein
MATAGVGGNSSCRSKGEIVDALQGIGRTDMGLSGAGGRAGDSLDRTTRVAGREASK